MRRNKHVENRTFRKRPEWAHFQAHIRNPEPNTFDEVKLGEFVSEKDAQIAQKIWSLPDRALRSSWKRLESRPYSPPESHELDGFLVRNVYAHLLADPLLPTSLEDEYKRKEAASLKEEKWDIDRIIFSSESEIIPERVESNSSIWPLNGIKKRLGGGWLSSRSSTDPASTIEDEIGKNLGVMPLSDLSVWGIQRSCTYTIQPTRGKKLSTLDMYTLAIHLSPYNPTYWISRAYCHYQQAYFDLALGDAYRAESLCEVLVNAKERNRQKGLYQRVWHAIEQHITTQPRRKGKFSLNEKVEYIRKFDISHFVPSIKKTVYFIKCLSLAGLGSFADLNTHVEFGTQLYLNPEEKHIHSLMSKLIEPAKDLHEKHKSSGSFFWHEFRQGSVCTNRVYPYQSTDANRFNSRFLNHLNSSIFGAQSRKKGFSNPCEAREASREEGLGVYATTDIGIEQLIHSEEPTIRGHLPPYRMRKDVTSIEDPFQCDNCRETLQFRSDKSTPEANVCRCAGAIQKNCRRDILLFCPSAAKSETETQDCNEIAKKVYHFGSCGKDWTWLYDHMRPKSARWYTNEHLYQSTDANGNYLSLLLRNIFEITLHRRKFNPNLCAHEIDELLVLEGNDGAWMNSRFPFSMQGNIRLPFKILSQLGVDIYRDLSFDTWVTQIILRKLLTNAVPWDQDRRGSVPDILHQDISKDLETPSEQDVRIKQKGSFKDWDSPFPNLYLFPGLSLFNHACRGAHNAEWGYDTEVPNRVVVWPVKNIKNGEEICLRYRDHRIRSQKRATRLLGRPCCCIRCTNENLEVNYIDASSTYSDTDQSLSQRSPVDSPISQPRINGFNRHITTVNYDITSRKRYHQRKISKSDSRNLKKQKLDGDKFQDSEADKKQRRKKESRKKE